MQAVGQVDMQDPNFDGDLEVEYFAADHYQTVDFGIGGLEIDDGIEQGVEFAERSGPGQNLVEREVVEQDQSYYYPPAAEPGYLMAIDPQLLNLANN